MIADLSALPLTDAPPMKCIGRPRIKNPGPDALRARDYRRRKRAGLITRTATPHCSYEFPLTCGFKPRPLWGYITQSQLDEINEACDRFLASRGILWASMADQITIDCAEAAS